MARWTQHKLSLHFFSRIKEDHVIQHGLVVDGASLSLALREHEKLFMEVCKNCSAVLCCRMAPLQKAKVPGLCYTHTHQNALPLRLKLLLVWSQHYVMAVIFSLLSDEWNMCMFLDVEQFLPVVEIGMLFY